MSVKVDKDTLNRDLEKQGRTVRLVGEYTKSSIKTKFSCLICNNVWETAPTNFCNKGRGCPKCAGTEKLSKDIVNSRIAHKNIILIDEYINSITKHDFKCLICYTTWKTTPNHVLHKSGCPECSNNAWNTPGFLYIFTSSMGTKIGISKNVERRVIEVRTASKFKDIKLYAYYKCGTGSKKETLAVEVALHDQFKHLKHTFSGFAGSSEFFNISPDEVAEFILHNYEVERVF